MPPARARTQEAAAPRRAPMGATPRRAKRRRARGRTGRGREGGWGSGRGERKERGGGVRFELARSQAFRVLPSSSAPFFAFRAHGAFGVSSRSVQSRTAKCAIRQQIHSRGNAAFGLRVPPPARPKDSHSAHRRPASQLPHSVPRPRPRLSLHLRRLCADLHPPER